MNLPAFAKRARLAAVAAALLLFSGCATTTRLDVKFDGDALASPSSSPSPSPPNDILSWTTSQQVTSTVVADPAGGRWLRIVPTPAFMAAPDFRKRAILATSDGFKTDSPNIRGHLRLRLDGLGTVIVGLRPLQGSQFSDFIAAIGLGSYAVPGGPSGQAYLLSGFSLARIENDMYPLPSAGKIADYQPGAVLDIFWSIDQVSRTFSVGAGGPSQSTTFPAISGGVATTPIQQVSLWVWLERPSSNTAVFIDNLYAEEVRP